MSFVKTFAAINRDTVQRKTCILGKLLLILNGSKLFCYPNFLMIDLSFQPRLKNVVSVPLWQ